MMKSDHSSSAPKYTELAILNMFTEYPKTPDEVETPEAETVMMPWPNSETQTIAMIVNKPVEIALIKYDLIFCLTPPLMIKFKTIEDSMKIAPKTMPAIVAPLIQRATSTPPEDTMLAILIIYNATNPK